MSESRKVLRGIATGVLLICTVYIVYSIIKDPLGKHDIMFALVVTSPIAEREELLLCCLYVTRNAQPARRQENI